MRIVHIFWSLTYGGIETMMVNIANEQVRLGHDVTILLVNEKHDPTLSATIDKRVRFINAGRKAGTRGFAFLFRLNNMLHRLRPDVIHLHGSTLYGLLLRKSLSRVACSTLHALPRGAVRRSGLLGRIPPANILPHEGNVALIDRVPKVFAISRAVHDELKAKYGVESTVVNNGIITGNFKRRDNDLPGERFRIVQVSRLEHDKKGQDLLIRAVADLHDEGISVDFIGEGKSLNYLQSLAKELNISGQVCFLGKRTQEYISAHLCDYDLFVQASRYEGFALTVAEAMAANVPVLVSAGQGPAEVCCEDTYGCVFANGDYNDLVAKIRWIRSQYPDALRKATKAREHVCAAYDVSVTARRYIEEYQKTGAINKETDG